jgi:hypothetical protein
MCANVEILPEADIEKVFLAFGSPRIEEYEIREVTDSLCEAVI